MHKPKRSSERPPRDGLPVLMMADQKGKVKDMLRTEIKAYTENEMRCTERKLKETGYTKANDCMWAKIYKKNNNEIVLTREY